MPLSPQPYAPTERLPPFSQIFNHNPLTNTTSVTPPTGTHTTSPWHDLPNQYHPVSSGRDYVTGTEALQRPYPSGPLAYNATRPALESPSAHSPLTNGYIPQQAAYAEESEARIHLSVSSSGSTHPGIHSPHMGSPARAVVREEEFPGRPSYYISNDGARLPPATDAEAINPHWGRTKAGKPRKRKAQACTTCREKKVKCISDNPDRCNHCRKYDRECRFEPYSRHAPRSPSLSSSTRSGAMDHPNYRPASSASRTSVANDAVAPDAHPPRSHSETPLDTESSQSPHLTASHGGAEAQGSGNAPTHRHRHGTEFAKSAATSHIAAARKRPHSDSPAVRPVLRTGGPPLAWEADPYEVDASMTEHYLHEYFTRINATTYCMFPRGPFLKWVRACRDKSMWDKMLLYAMLAHGCLFSLTAQQRTDGETCSTIAHLALEKSSGVLNLQVVQSRLILAMLDFATGKTNTAWELGGSALRTACGMRLNLEDGVTDVHSDQGSDFGLNRATLVECRRRTFWCAYAMDRFNTFAAGHLSTLSSPDTHLRLPCEEAQYEEGQIPGTPFFRNVPLGPSSGHDEPKGGLGVTAYLVQLSSVWGEVMSHIYWSRYHAPTDHAELSEKFYKSMSKELQLLGDVYQGAQSHDGDNALSNGSLGQYDALHILYHSTQMKLNRYTRHESMTATQIQRNVRIAYNHACETLRLIKGLMQVRRTEQQPKLGSAGSTPFTGFAILMAIDILTARGLVSDLCKPDGPWMSLLTIGIQALEDLARYWHSAKRQLVLARDRLRDLSTAVQSHQATVGSVMPTAFLATEALNSAFGPEYDLVYALPARQYLDVLEMGRHDEHGGGMLEIKKEIKKAESW